MKHSLTFARHAPVLCLAPRLFRSLAPGDRKKFKLDGIYDIDEKRKIEFRGPEPLGADDLRVLQGLIAMAGPKGDLLGPTPRTEAGIVVRDRLELKWDSANEDAILVRGSFCELAREIGLASCSGQHIKQLRKSIDRLGECSLDLHEEKKRRGFRMLATLTSDSQKAQLYVALNPAIAAAITQSRHTRIEMAEVRALKSDPARLLHQRLSAILPPRATKPHRFELDTLCGYVWPDPANAEAIKKRRQSARKALQELVAVGWNVDEYVKGKFGINRP